MEFFPPEFFVIEKIFPNFSQGTKRRRKEDIEREVENIGATLNAYTTREQTCYLVQCFQQDIPQMVIQFKSKSLSDFSS